MKSKTIKKNTPQKKQPRNNMGGQEIRRLDQNWGCIELNALFALNSKFNIGNALMYYFNEIIRQYLKARKSGILLATCKRECGRKAFLNPCGIFFLCNLEKDA